jgi:hypothetical protein
MKPNLGINNGEGAQLRQERHVYRFGAKGDKKPQRGGMEKYAAKSWAEAMPPRWGWGELIWARSSINMPLLTELNAPILEDWFDANRKFS